MLYFSKMTLAMLLFSLAACTTKPTPVILPDSRTLDLAYDSQGKPLEGRWTIDKGYLRAIIADLNECAKNK